MPWRIFRIPVCWVLHVGGIATAIGSGLYAVEVPNTATGQAGAAAAVSGCVIAIASAAFAYLNDQGKRKADRDRLLLEERRQIRAERDLQGQLDRALRERDADAERIKRLEKTSADVPANAGRLDAALIKLKDAGWIESPSPADAPPGTAWPKILIVEDDPSLARAWTSLLTGEGYDVLAADTVESAVAKLALRPAAALLDLTLPDGNGEAILDAIRALDLPTRVVVASGSADEARLDKIRAEYHPAAVMAKPVKWQALRDVLQPSRSDDNLPVYRPPAGPSPPKGG